MRRDLKRICFSRTLRFCFVFVAFYYLLGASNAFSATIAESSTLLAKPPAKASRIFGLTQNFPDYNKVAFAVRQNDKMFVQVNDSLSPEYNNIGKGTPVFAPFTGKLGYIVYTDENDFVVIDGVPDPAFEGLRDLQFSPDGKTYAYIAMEKKQQKVVVNGQKHPGYLKINGNPIFSSDSKHIAYIAIKTKKIMALVLDGKEIAAYPYIKDPVFLPGENTLAYAALFDNKFHLIHNGSKGEGHDNVTLIRYLPKTKQIAYVAQEKKKLFLVVDGKEKKQYDSLSNPMIHDDGQISYPAQVGGKWIMVLGDREGEEFEMLGPRVLAPGNQMAYVGVKNNKGQVVLNGNNQEKYDSVGLPVFSSDGKHLAYRARDKNEWFVVLDGKPGKKYVTVTQPVFSPDGKRIAYIGTKPNKKLTMVVDHNEEGEFDNLGRPFFSPDSKHVVHSAILENSSYLVFDGLKTKEAFAGFLRKVPIIFENNTKVRGLALRFPGPEFFMVEAEFKP